MTKTIILIFALFSIAFAANRKCTSIERKATFCPLDFSPICGISQDKSVRKTYGNRCSACGDENVDFLVQGSCEDFPKDAYFCNPDESHTDNYCPEGQPNDPPVCGHFDGSIQCFRAPCGSNFSNKCKACQQSIVIYSVPGSCN